MNRLAQFLAMIAIMIAATDRIHGSSELRTFASPHLRSDKDGHCFVRSIPKTGSGAIGKTQVFRVRRSEDELLHSHEWYAHSLAIRCGHLAPDHPSSVSLVRMGSAGRSALGETSGYVTLSFLLDGELIAEYSNMDLALISRYHGIHSTGGIDRGFSKALGFVRFGDRERFEICSADARVLSFDVVSGDLIDERPDGWNRCGQGDQRYSHQSRSYITTYYEEATDLKRPRVITVVD